LGLSAVTGMGLLGWFMDLKVISMTLAWALLGIVLMLNHWLVLKGGTRACLILCAFVLIAFAILGVAILGATRHDFSGGSATIFAGTGYILA
jgi:hypothetical protein